MSAAITRIGTAFLGLLLAQNALAWTHTTNVWLPEDFPLRYWVADDGSPQNSLTRCEESGGMEGCCEESVPGGYCIQAAAEGFDAWHAASCADFSVEYQDVCPNIDQAYDSRYYITFNDPGKNMPPGVLAWTVSLPSGTAKIIDGQEYRHFSQTDIVFNDDVTFVTHDDAAQGCPSTGGSGSNIRGVMTHEIGHSLGMDHSCEDPDKGGAPCTDPVLLDATMYWTEGDCETGAIEINQDDIEGFTTLYGPYAGFECSHQDTNGVSVGVVPFDLHCVITSDYLVEVVSAEWNFGDGGTANATTATHTYTEPGNYTVQLTVHGEREACGPQGWSNSFRRVGYVRACGMPEPEFEVTHIDGLKYQMLNNSNVKVYGCISNIQWTVYEGDGTGGKVVLDKIQAWEPVIELPEAGTYTVVMNLGGIGGTGGAKATFEAKNRRGEGRGCDIGFAGGASAGVIAVAGLLAIRRRRSA